MSKNCEKIPTLDDFFILFKRFKYVFFLNRVKCGKLYASTQISHGQTLVMTNPLWSEPYDVKISLQSTVSHMKWTGHLALRSPMGTVNLTAQKINFSWTYKKSKK